jgi:hypothetical protein
MERRLRGSDSGHHLVRRRSTEGCQGDGWWLAMVSGSSELQHEVEVGRCWGGVGGVRAAWGLIYRPRGRGEMAGMGGSRAVQEPHH